jgi:CPA1 family monovalent cation:H+ antiporter
VDILMIGVLGALAVVLVTALAPKVGVAAPLLLVALGVLVSLIPAVPAVEIEPEWILAGVLPPLLYGTSPRSAGCRCSWWPARRWRSVRCCPG